ncbi:factor of DNA methylation 2-like [Coffea arabica]|uniref:Factor of DNA methylation 2-like n=1 Tax=Coffea arabica TaxID=13443 RepID=A0A6P6W4B1_COFAR|nr:factor of DNA methylation 5-like [Coffea arabica]
MDCIGEEVFKKRRRLCIALAREIDNKNEKLLEMERTMKEKDILLKEALEAKQSFKLELEKLKSRMEFQKKELEQQGKEEFNHWQATVVAQGRKQENSDMGCVVESQKMNLEQAINEIEKFDSKTDLNGQHTMGNKDELMQLKVYLKALEDKVSDMEDEHQALITKERMMNDELQDARKEAIRALQGLSTHHLRKFQIKRMGQIDTKPFEALFSNKCSSEDWNAEAIKLCSLWEENVRSANWHPFKRVENRGRLIEIIDDNDEKLKELRSEYGEDVFKAVANALMELNEYNPSGRYPVSELWDCQKGRKASLKEIIEYISNKLKTLQPKRKRS